MLTIEQICHLFEKGGDRTYAGEPVTQLEHALQSAALAQQAGADVELVCAALLHDLGHLVNDKGDTPTARGIDDLHQYCMLPLLRKLFRPAVLEPIRLHVEAKRYLCAIDFEYLLHLSADSRRSLHLQGGVFTPEQAAEFSRKPFAQDALRLRAWDDRAKMARMKTPALSEFVPVMQTCAALKAAEQPQYS
ncbi:phosphonate degradation HD-domain oxygenase [Noviherbaspirillum saxi]|uniref:HD domain-containing protein n=1 Tax=Noviherbaspirillum saxi TaxID=2320863 RepID=A0A3A3FPW7_9BURK|nr:phosphonate degradation HD-domain oxygenase [Noviherbaspirillum saxi]RJF98066.1 HD domain-containing protein [Noviherbaspirillum saxi]